MCVCEIEKEIERECVCRGCEGRLDTTGGGSV